jgi:hypothetical protein
MLNYQRVSWYIPTNIALKHGPYESTHAETLRMGDAREHLELFDGTHLVQRWQLGSVSICGPYYLLYDLYNSMYIYINYIYICIHISNIHIKYIYILLKDIDKPSDNGLIFPSAGLLEQPVLRV